MVELKFVLVVVGVLSVSRMQPIEMPVLSADKLDMVLQVSCQLLMYY